MRPVHSLIWLSLLILMLDLVKLTLSTILNKLNLVTVQINLFVYVWKQDFIIPS